MRHPGMARAFASWIGKHPDDGRFILTNGYDWTYFSVEDTPYFVESVKLGERGLLLVLFDGSEEPLDPAGLWLDESGVFRVRVKAGGYEARFLRQAQLELGRFLNEEPDGSITLAVRGERSKLAF